MNSMLYAKYNRFRRDLFKVSSVFFSLMEIIITRLTDYCSRDILEKTSSLGGLAGMADGLKQDLYEKIVQQYQETKSVRDTAQRCGTSLVTAQRVLIT